jgi:hypothetical protein
MYFNFLRVVVMIAVEEAVGDCGESVSLNMSVPKYS